MAGGKEGKKSTVYHIVPREEAGNGGGGGGNGAGVGHGGDGGGGGPAAGEQQQAGRESERQALSFVDLGLGIFLSENSLSLLEQGNFSRTVEDFCPLCFPLLPRWLVTFPAPSSTPRRFHAVNLFLCLLCLMLS